MIPTDKRKTFVAPSRDNPGQFGVWVPVQDGSGEWVAIECESYETESDAISAAFHTERYMERNRKRSNAE